MGLTAGAVRRRILRLEQTRVITGYTVNVNDNLVGPSIEAYVELSFSGDVSDVHALLGKAMERPQVREAMTIAGDPDALLRLRVSDLAELREVVSALRRDSHVTSSKTKIVIGRWPQSRAF